MRYGSVCSGVEAASLAWMPLGWECVFVSEVEPFPCALLQRRFGATAPIHPLEPDEAANEKDRAMRKAWMRQNAKLKTEGKIPNEGDFTKIGRKYAGRIDLLVGGTPCQDLSVAGKRAGFDGKRSSLAIDFVRLAYESQCKWFVWENVPGVFSSNGGGDFATLLSLFTGCEVGVPEQGFGNAGFVCNARRDRFGVAWRVLDAHFTRVPGFPFAIPQRRRRVFVVGYFGDWTRAAEVCIEPDRLSWDTPARIKTREIFAGNAGNCLETADADGFLPQAGAEAGLAYTRGGTSTLTTSNVPGCLTFQVCQGSGRMTDTSATLDCKCKDGIIRNSCGMAVIETPSGQDVSDTLDASYHKGPGNRNGKERTVVFDARGNGDGETVNTITGDHQSRRTDYTALAITENQIGRKPENGPNGIGVQEELAYTQNATGTMGECSHSLVRRLTPVECERLMGFPDNHTRIAYNGKPEEDCPDSPRYKACGNSMCVNVMEWIGRQIERVDKEKGQQ